jgi:ribosomal protein S18 acetylase RimI-like enzyme
MMVKAMLTIHAIREDERDELRTMAVAYWLELMPHAPVIQDPQRREGYFQNRFRFDTPESTLWWAMIDENRAGFARIDLALDHDGPWAEIQDFYVAEEWRGQGTGRAFAKCLVEWLRAHDVVRIDLHVRSDNPRALAFWQAVGFEMASYRLRTYIE